MTELDENRPSFWQSAFDEMDSKYPFVARADLQPAWDVPAEIAINAAVAGRSGDIPQDGYPIDIEEYTAAASDVIEAGACGVHIDFTWVTDSKGRRLDKDLSPVEAYALVLEPLRRRFDDEFVANLNILNGDSFAECLSPATVGLAEVAPCAAGHPVAFVDPAIRTLLAVGVSPEIVVHHSGEVELAKRRLFDTGLLTTPTNWIILFGLPVDHGRTLISGAWTPDAKSMATHLFMIVEQIRSLDQGAAITVCNAGRANLYITTLATMMGLNIRVGLEDSSWRHPNTDDRTKSNHELFLRARTIAEELGRRPASADQYRAQIGLPRRGESR